MFGPFFVFCLSVLVDSPPAWFLLSAWPGTRTFFNKQVWAAPNPKGRLGIAGLSRPDPFDGFADFRGPGWPHGDLGSSAEALGSWRCGALARPPLAP